MHSDKIFLFFFCSDYATEWNMQPRQYGGDYSAQATRPPKDISSPGRARPPVPPPTYMSCIVPSEHFNGSEDDQPPVVPPRRKNSPTFSNNVTPILADPASGRPPARPALRSNNHVGANMHETSMMSRVVPPIPPQVSAPTVIHRPIPHHHETPPLYDDFTPPGTPPKRPPPPQQLGADPNNGAANQTVKDAIVRVFISFSHVFYLISFYFT